MDTFIFGQTSRGLPILGHNFGRKGAKVLILGGVHGNEPEGVIAALGLVQNFAHNFTQQIQLTIVPMLNLDGIMAKDRRNARNVDLNRNLPTKDWAKDFKEEKYHPGLEANSEPENHALVTWIEQNKPQFVISLHSWKPCVNINGNCQPEAEIINKITNYEILKNIGYPTPGSLGTYCGLERDIPTITYEIERGLDAGPILKTHVQAVTEALKSVEKRF